MTDFPVPLDPATRNVWGPQLLAAMDEQYAPLDGYNELVERYNPLYGYDELVPFYAALANRNNERVNVGILGASLAEGYPVTSFDKTIGQHLVNLLRARFPTAGLTGGGRGYIGIPTAVTQGAGWPLVFTNGTFSDAIHFGGKHRVWSSSTFGHKYSDTLPAAITSFKIPHYKGTGGTATAGYYKIGAAAAVYLDTYAAATTLELKNVASAVASGTVIEVGCLGGGSIVADGIIEYNGDELKGIQVHNLGHASFSTAQWEAHNPSTPGWREMILALELDVLVIQDLGVNDAYTANGNKTAAQFQTDMLAFIAFLRAGGITCPILLAACYDTTTQLTFREPWPLYVAVMAEIADSDPTVRFVDHSARMPSTASNALGLYWTTDGFHGNPNGKAYAFMAQTYAEALAPR